jgi:hypothetical protein
MKWIIATLCAVLLCGCSTINSISTTAGIAIAAAVEAGTDELIIKKGGPTPAGELAYAKNVKAIAAEIGSVAAGTTTVAQLSATLQPYIAKLSPPEQVLAQALLSEVVVALGVQVQKGLLNTAATAVLTDILASVNTAASSFGA